MHKNKGKFPSLFVSIINNNITLLLSIDTSSIFLFINNLDNESSRKPDKPLKAKSLNIDNKKKDNSKRWKKE
jgi:hypothetical protein